MVPCGWSTPIGIGKRIHKEKEIPKARVFYFIWYPFRYIFWMVSSFHALSFFFLNRRKTKEKRSFFLWWSLCSCVCVLFYFYFLLKQSMNDVYRRRGEHSLTPMSFLWCALLFTRSKQEKKKHMEKVVVKCRNRHLHVYTNKDKMNWRSLPILIPFLTLFVLLFFFFIFRDIFTNSTLLLGNPLSVQRLGCLFTWHLVYIYLFSSSKYTFPVQTRTGNLI